MYTAILKLFTSGGVKAIGKKWHWFVIAGLSLIITYQNVSDTRWVLWADTIPYLRNELATRSFELDLVEQSNAQLTQDIENRNAEIDRWRAVTNQLEESTALLQEEISEISVESNERIRIVEREVIPQECTGAMHFLYDSVPELQYDDILQLEGGL